MKLRCCFLPLVLIVLPVSALVQVQDKTQGVPWPMPQSMVMSNTTYFLDGERFRFVATGSLTTEGCDLLQMAFQRYYKMLFDDFYFEAMGQQNEFGRMSIYKEYSPVRQLSVSVSGTCEKMPYLHMDESCKEC